MTEQTASKLVSIALVGIGGYGRTYVKALLQDGADAGVKLVGAIDPNAKQATDFAELQSRGVPMFTSLSDFYRQHRADLVIISAPIHLHAPLTCEALAHDSNVLCEKPLAATVQEADQIAAAEATSRGFVAIGYQWSFSAAIQALKQDILAGKLGAAKRLKTLVLWPRTRAYYQRSNWAGVLASDNGTYILDSPVNNATAHYLHNMFYVLGDASVTSAMPTIVEAELYRANPIQNYDTAGIRAKTTTGVEILFFASHAVQSIVGPVFEYEFEDAVVRYDSGGCRMVAQYRSGHVHDYGNPGAQQAGKLWQCVEAVRAGAAAAPCCGVAAARAQTLCINAAQATAEQISTFAPELITTEMLPNDDQLTWVKRLPDILVQGYSAGLLPSELGSVAWARSSRRVDATSLTAFPPSR